MGQLFAVPLLIIGTIVGGAVTVVFLFGGPASTSDRPMSELLDVLEASSGERSLGLLLTREKALWQAALELSMQLKDAGQELPLQEQELDSTAKRISRLVFTGLADLDHLASLEHTQQSQWDVRSRRLEFLIHALGKTRRPIAVEKLIEVVRGRREPYVQAAMHELADLHEMPQTRAAIDPIVALLDTEATAETHLMACTALSVLAKASDDHVIESLASVRLRKEGEVAWSAALALARLGSSAGTSTLLDLLDREFLSSGKLYKVGEGSGRAFYEMPPQRIEQTLLAAIDAATNLDDPEIWKAIDLLASDESPVVRAKAQEAVHARS